MTLIAAAMLYALYAGWVPLWGALSTLAAWWLLTLPGNTWFAYAAAMTYDRVKRGGQVVLPYDPAEWQNSRDIDNLVSYQLWFPAAFKNYVLSKFVCIFYFRRWPHWADAGLTVTLNRMVREEKGWRYDRARAIQKRYLDRYDRRGKHT